MTLWSDLCFLGLKSLSAPPATSQWVQTPKATEDDSEPKRCLTFMCVVSQVMATPVSPEDHMRVESTFNEKAGPVKDSVQQFLFQHVLAYYEGCLFCFVGIVVLFLFSVSPNRMTGWMPKISWSCLMQVREPTASPQHNVPSPCKVSLPAVICDCSHLKPTRWRQRSNILQHE